MISDPNTQGTGPCAGTTLGAFYNVLSQNFPFVRSRGLNTPPFYDPNVQMLAGTYDYAYQKPDGGFAIARHGGSGDCELGCTLNWYAYYSSDASCAPVQVGHYKSPPAYNSPPTYDPINNCNIVDGAPMWGRPAPVDPISPMEPVHDCGTSLSAKNISGTYHFKGCGSFQPLGLDPIDNVPPVVPYDITMVIAQNDQDLSQGTVTVQGTGNPLMDGRPLSATFTRWRFTAELWYDATPEDCSDTVNVWAQYDFEGWVSGGVGFQEYKLPDCSHLEISYSSSLGVQIDQSTTNLAGPQ
jgi:hypothetical protein